MSNPLDLNLLLTDDMDFEHELPKITAELEDLKQECKEKYGEDWHKEYERRIDKDIVSDLDSYEEYANQAIFEGHIPWPAAHPLVTKRTSDRYYEKMKRLFGPLYKRHIDHKKNDPKINQALIQDALKSGKWRELPKELYDEYHRQADT